MQISFFEEFPTKKNLDKLNLVDFPIKSYLAAESYGKFIKIKNQINKNYPLCKSREFIYWPILDIKEGYWLSAFSNRKALKRIFGELKDKKISVMLDLELPTTKNSKLYLTQFFNFCFNRRLTKQFIKQHQGKVYLGEYWPLGRIKIKILQFLGLHYNLKKVKIIKMLYHSMLPFPNHLFARELELGKKEYGNNYLAGFGTIARGVAIRPEPILSPEKLKEDLEMAKKVGVEEVVIFRLGGLNAKYLKVLKEF